MFPGSTLTPHHSQTSWGEEAVQLLTGGPCWNCAAGPHPSGTCHSLQCPFPIRGKGNCGVSRIGGGLCVTKLAVSSSQQLLSPDIDAQELRDVL
jgi:hypothetical protein